MSSKYMKSFSINKHYFGISGHQQSWQQHFPFFVFFCFLNEQQQPGQKPRGPLGAPVTGLSWCSGRRWALGASPARAGGRQQTLTVLPECLRLQAGRRGQTRRLPGGGAAETHPGRSPAAGHGPAPAQPAPGRPGLRSIQGRPSPPLGTAGQVAPTPAASV